MAGGRRSAPNIWMYREVRRGHRWDGFMLGGARARERAISACELTALSG